MNSTLTILLIEKDGTICEKNIKPIMLNKLYSVCGYRTNKEVNFLKYPIYVGANRGRGQINPTGEKTNNNTVLASAAGKVENISFDASGNYEISIKNSDGLLVTQSVPKYYELDIVKGQLLTLDQAITKEPNVGGFGQTETEIVLQSASRIYGYIAICFVIILTQIFLVIKKKQFEKVQASELNF